VVPVKETNLKYAITPDGQFGKTTQALLEALMSPEHPEAPIDNSTATDTLGVHEAFLRQGKDSRALQCVRERSGQLYPAKGQIYHGGSQQYSP